jgi:spore coat-associated protein N
VSIRRNFAGSGLALKVVASLGVLGSAAAIAATGSFGSFTDSTTPVDQTVGTGVLSIALDGVNTSAANPVSIGGLQPGKSSSVPFDVRNDGGVGWSSVTFESWATVSSRLDSDAANGLQLTLRSCSDSWTAAGPGAYTCGGEATDLYAGPIVTRSTLTTGGAGLQAGEVDHLLFTAAIPASAGNQLKDLSSELAFTLTATQRAGTAR